MSGVLAGVCAAAAAAACASLASGQDVSPEDPGDDAAADVANVSDVNPSVDEADAFGKPDAAVDAPPRDSQPGAPCPALASGASIFVIDSTEHLFAFDANGNSIANVPVAGPVGSLNGGGIALASGGLYTTNGEQTNTVSVFGLDLAPRELPDGSFASLFVPRGIAFDCREGMFVVGNGGKNIATFSALGAPWQEGDAGFDPYYGPSGVAFDSDDGTFWITNYAGFPSTKWGVEEFAVTGDLLQASDPLLRFTPPGPHEEPYSIAVCSQAATGAGTTVIVGFLDDGSGLGTPSVKAYTTDGAPSSMELPGIYSAPSAISCDSRGRVFIADGSGLHVVRLDAKVDAGGTAGFAGLTPPIYGVLAAD